MFLIKMTLIILYTHTDFQGQNSQIRKVFIIKAEKISPKSEENDEHVGEYKRLLIKLASRKERMKLYELIDKENLQNVK